ncbi:MAG: hypothetical protein ACFB02_16255 [Mastigocoleus sp.]
MASKNDVQKYLAAWFQLGKAVVVSKGGEKLLPHPIFQGDNYSKQFQECWQKITSPELVDCYLEGTDTTISELLTPAWEVNPCARCEMPVTIKNFSTSESNCVCSDLENWPDTDLPAPRSQMSSLEKLRNITERLNHIKV